MSDNSNIIIGDKHYHMPCDLGILSKGYHDQECLKNELLFTLDETTSFALLEFLQVLWQKGTGKSINVYYLRSYNRIHAINDICRLTRLIGQTTGFTLGISEILELVDKDVREF